MKRESVLRCGMVRCSLQKSKRDHYLNMNFMRDFNEETFTIANAWLDSEVIKFVSVYTLHL